VVNKMCDYEDMDLVHSYTRQQAVDDGVLTHVLSYHGLPVMATTGIVEDFGTEELLEIFREFIVWKQLTKPTLKEEDQLFSCTRDKKKIWVIEDVTGYTVLYPSEY
jgi:hypothetical protein